MMVLTSTLSCAACGGPVDLGQLPRPYPAKGRRSADMFKEIYFCGACGLGTASPRLSDSQIDAIYEEGRRLLPLFLQEKFYHWLFQPRTIKKDGMWLRMLLSHS